MTIPFDEKIVVVKIYSNMDEQMTMLGQILTVPKSRKIYSILIEKELTIKEIGQIIDNEENPRLPNLFYHLHKMVNIGLVRKTQKQQRGSRHKLIYYKAVPIIIIASQYYYEQTIKNKSLAKTIENFFETARFPEAKKKNNIQ